jgi:hypothetical protein
MKVSLWKTISPVQYSAHHDYSATTSNEASLLAQTGRMKTLKTDLISHILFEIRDEVVAK